MAMGPVAVASPLPFNTTHEGNAMETVQIEVWVMVDEGGDYAVSSSADTLHEAYDEQVGGDRDTLSLRRVKVTLTVPKPKPAELVGTVAAEPDAGELKAVA